MAFGLDSIKWNSKERRGSSDFLTLSTKLEPIGYIVDFELQIAKDKIDVTWELSDNGSRWGIFDKGNSMHKNKDSAYVYIVDTLSQLAQTYSDWDYKPLKFMIPHKETA